MAYFSFVESHLLANPFLQRTVQINSVMQQWTFKRCFSQPQLLLLSEEEDSEDEVQSGDLDVLDLSETPPTSDSEPFGDHGHGLAPYPLCRNPWASL